MSRATVSRVVNRASTVDPALREVVEHRVGRGPLSGPSCDRTPLVCTSPDGYQWVRSPDGGNQGCPVWQGQARLTLSFLSSTLDT
ncbi:hypothetical protein [Serinicoccus marinus]|uniref:hypothetical protein n=1 Tax=Serinicoccus marinus TaxID=247333 RepID=UPI003CD0D269